MSGSDALLGYGQDPGAARRGGRWRGVWMAAAATVGTAVLAAGVLFWSLSVRG